MKMLVVHSHAYMMEVNAEGQEEGKIVAEKDADEYYCYTVITHEYAIADAIICGYDIDLSGVHVVEEVKKGEIDG